MLNLESNIRFIKGVGEKRAELFNSLGVFDVDSLLHFYPRKYEDWSRPLTVREAVAGEVACIKATMVSVVSENLIRKGLTLYKCRFSDGESIIEVTIFNNKYLAKALRIYEDYILFGKLEKNFNIASMASPQIEKADNAMSIKPIYSAKEKLSSSIITQTIKNALEAVEEIPEPLSTEILNKYNIIPLDRAIRDIHFPQSSDDYARARKRLIFDELLILQLGLLRLKNAKKQETAIKIKKDYSEEFKSLLPFEMTSAQKKALADCVSDMLGSFPMNRLIQGDVGSGKTAVAAGAIYTTVKNGYQAAFMAPTEILAVQHFETLEKMMSPCKINVRLLTGSTTAAKKREIKRELLDGEIDLIVGTHAIIQNDVVFKNLGLVITDEQHRFGVKQRAALAEKGSSVHTIVMSATPIPRTLGLIIYGELDVSIIDELPPGRQEIRTDVVDSSYTQRIYKFIRSAVDRGEQCYMICPMVEDGELVDVKSAIALAEDLSQNAFKGYNLGLIHGKMKAKEKDSVMKAFAAGDISILVATTVVEVGVDVPNATIMVIENAERFGLSQLHQLRGRIGRGNKKSYCILISDSESEQSRERLYVMKKYSDGFKIADEDLKARGPGDFFGSRQHGLPDLKIADMVNDVETLRQTQNCAAELLSFDKTLSHPDNRLLKKRVEKMFDRLYI